MKTNLYATKDGGLITNTDKDIIRYLEHSLAEAIIKVDYFKDSNISHYYFRQVLADVYEHLSILYNHVSSHIKNDNEILIIEPCPLCQSPAVVTQRGGGYTVDCSKANSMDIIEASGCPGFLSLQMDMFPTPEKAIANWNEWARNTMTLCLIDMINEHQANYRAMVAQYKVGCNE